MTRLLAWLSFLLLLAAPLALADDDRDGKDGEKDEEKDDRDGKDERKLELDVEDLKATIKLEREIAGLEDSVKIEFDAEKAKVQVKHEEETEGNETEEKLEARFLALVEFVDGNGNGAYDQGETLASAWALSRSEKDAKVPTNGTVDWDDIVVSDVTSGNATGKKLSGRASFGPNATFGLDFFVYGHLTTIGTHSLLPTEAKIDILIEHYPYVRGDSQLAVIVDLKAKEEFESEDDEGEEGIGSAADDGNLSFRLTFTWLPNATVDGVDRDVHATVLKEKQESGEGEQVHKARVAIAYPRGDAILHDPTVGVSYATASEDARVVPLPAAMLLVATVAAIALTQPRHRKE